jgi:hypothetical protein
LKPHPAEVAAVAAECDPLRRTNRSTIVTLPCFAAPFACHPGNSAGKALGYTKEHQGMTLWFKETGVNMKSNTRKFLMLAFAVAAPGAGFLGTVNAGKAAPVCTFNWQAQKWFCR